MVYTFCGRIEIESFVWVSEWFGGGAIRAVGRSGYEETCSTRVFSFQKKKSRIVTLLVYCTAGLVMYGVKCVWNLLGNCMGNLTG
jgi:hypothetical protein